jgi:hypothetical protein
VEEGAHVLDEQLWRNPRASDGGAESGSFGGDGWFREFEMARRGESPEQRVS